MKGLFQIIFLIIVITFTAGNLSAQKVEVDISACEDMYYVLFAMKNGESKAKIALMLDTVLNSRAYKTMFRHYNRSWRPNHLPEAVFRKMILNLQFNGEYSIGSNKRADMMLVFWQKAYNDLPQFKKNLDQLKMVDLNNVIGEAAHYAQNWLPSEWIIPDSYLFIHPNGGSNGFVIDGSQGYDFFQIPRDSVGNIKVPDLARLIRHELHHLGLKDSIPGSMTPGDSAAYLFLSLFVGEGTATKFIDNAPGGFVPSINPAVQNFFTGKLDTLWKSYTAKEQEIFNRFISTFEMLYSGKMKKSELDTEINSYWLTGLKGPAYFLGSEFFGAIYYGFGKEKTFEAMKDPRKILSLYSEAIKKNPVILEKCIPILDSVLSHSLSIRLVH